jgi:hypothetical protein
MATATKIGGLLLPAMNIVNNMEVWQFFADNATIGTTLEGINAGNATQVHPVILGEDIDLVSADAADDVGSTGATEVTVKYLDANFAAQSEAVAMNGATEVEMTDQNITFINEAIVTGAGTGLASAGAITIADVTGGGVHGIIDIGATRMGSTKCMIPANSQGYIYGFWYDILNVGTGTGTAEVHLQIAEFGTSGVANSETWQTVAKMEQVENDDDVVAATGGNANSMGRFEFPGGLPFIVPAKCMVRLAAMAPAAVAINAGFSIVVAGEGSGTVTTDS